MKSYDYVEYIKKIPLFSFPPITFVAEKFFG